MNNCPICKYKETKELLKWKTYSINKCNNCRLIFSTPLPTDIELEEFYQGFMFKKPEEWKIQELTKKRKKELIKFFNLPDKAKSLSNKKFLDFGGGTGIVYNAICELGFDAYYQDLDKGAITFTVEKFGLTSEKTIYDINKCDIKFDYIFSDNVIEHVINPYDFLKDLLHQLEEGGTIVVKTPHASNTESIFNPIITLKGYFLNALKYNSLQRAAQACFKRFWHCDPPRHLYSFSKNSLSHLMTKIETEKIDFEILYYKIPWFENTITQQIFTKDKRLKGFKSFLIRLVLLPVIPLEVLLQTTQYLFLLMGVLSPGGIILRINKRHITKNKAH